MSLVVYSVMPVASDPDHVLRRATVGLAARTLGMDVYFPLDHRQHHEDFEVATIRNEIERCAVAVVDLTLERPSCYYELGMVQGVGVDTILVAEAGTQIHQTAGRKSVAFYESFEELRDNLVQLLRPYSAT